MPAKNSVQNFIEAIDARNEAEEAEVEEFSSNDDLVFSVPMSTDGVDDDWEFDESEVVHLVDEDDEEPEDSTESDSDPEVQVDYVDTDTGSGPVSESESESDPGSEPQTDSEVSETPSWNFGYSRQTEDSGTHATALWKGLLADGSVVVDLDTEVSDISSGLPIEKARAAVLNRIRNRLLKSGGYDKSSLGAKGAITMTRNSDNQVTFDLVRAPAYVSPTGRLTKIGKIVAAFNADGQGMTTAAFGDGVCDPHEVDKIVEAKAKESESGA